MRGSNRESDSHWARRAVTEKKPSSPVHKFSCVYFEARRTIRNFGHSMLCPSALTLLGDSQRSERTHRSEFSPFVIVSSMRDPNRLRSHNWFTGHEYEHVFHRAWLRSEGFGPEIFEGKPIIGICNSWSELTNCNAHLRQLAEAVKRGVWAAGGVPLEFPTIFARRAFHESHDDALPQPDVDGCRGVRRRQPD